MSVELTETQKALLPYMTNELYDRKHSVIAKHFPIKQDVGRRLVDNGLLTSEEYVEISGLAESGSGSRLICTLRKKGDDSMKTFYKVLLSAKGERDVDVILQDLEADAERIRKDSGVNSQLDPNEQLPPITYDSKVDMAIKHILELQVQIRELHQSMHTLEQQNQRIQALLSQPTGPLGSHTASASSFSYMTVPSRNNSAHSDCSDDYVSLNGNSQMGSSAVTMYTAVQPRRSSLPTQPSRNGSQPGNKHASGNGTLQGIPEREDSMSCSQLHSPEMRQGSAVKSEEKEYQQLQVRHRRHGAVAINPLKAIARVYRRMSQSGHDAEGKT